MNSPAQLSSRASSSTNTGRGASSRLGEVRSHCFYNQYDPETNQDGIIALAIAENKLMRDDICEFINQVKITPWHLTYGNGPQGSIQLRRAVSDFMNREFQPLQPTTLDHVCICNGAGSAVDNLSFVLADPGEGILIGRPLYTGFFPDIEARAKAKVVQVPFGSVDPLSPPAVACYESALLHSNADGVRIRAILISNPHNPLGRPYSPAFLSALLSLCSKHNIHLISDEVYLKSFFPSHDFPSSEPFTSILSLPISNYCSPALVHVIYGMSKDFCANGIRIGCLISPFNTAAYKAFKSVSSFTRASQIAEQVWLQLLTDSQWQEWYFPELTKRMTLSYEHVTGAFRQHSVPYSPASATSFIWFDLRRYLKEDSEDAEIDLNWRMARAGVWIAAGGSFGAEQHGWFRLTFATPREELEMGLERLFKLLKEIEQEKEEAGMWQVVDKEELEAEPY